MIVTQDGIVLATKKEILRELSNLRDRKIKESTLSTLLSKNQIHITAGAARERKKNGGWRTISPGLYDLHIVLLVLTGMGLTHEDRNRIFTGRNRPAFSSSLDKGKSTIEKGEPDKETPLAFRTKLSRGIKSNQEG